MGAFGLDKNQANDSMTIDFTVSPGSMPGTNCDITITGYQLNDKGTYHELVVNTANIGIDPIKWDTYVSARFTLNGMKVFSSSQTFNGSAMPFLPGTAKPFVFKVINQDTNQKLADGVYSMSLMSSYNGSCPEINYTNNDITKNITLPPLERISPAIQNQTISPAPIRPTMPGVTIPKPLQ
jgi:hypothetical protein